MRKATLIVLVMLALAASAVAQNKLSTAVQCAKAEKDYKIDVGDKPGHVFEIVQGKCSYTKGEIEGVQIKEEQSARFSEINKDAGRGRALCVITMANGDKVYFREESTTTLKDGVAQTEDGKVTYTGGTGKFKGISGKGTYKAKFAADGTVTAEGEGEYALPAAKK